MSDGYVGVRGDFTIETREAGYGMLMIRVHGVKDAYKINAVPISDDDPRTLVASYDPKQPGKYSISIHWAGQHVPGSPYEVIIRGEGQVADDGIPDDDLLPEPPSSSWPSRPRQNRTSGGGG
ncbi:filamin/ABP280 repeat domain-containing protein, partial [Salmonella sp. s54836]|uniref:filamin/ABP280 repeat domain-containing protein n=1 Tax=Salmonella sp. s54836 TaxID=3159673 RepID=UPI0039809B3D